MKKRYLDRIPDIENFEESVCREICDSYGFGKYQSYSVVETGYEDVTFILETGFGKYFVKLFSKERKPEDCKRIVDLLILLIRKGVHHPRVYKDKKGKYLHKKTVNSDNLYLIVMDFIDGKNFFDLGEVPSRKEINQLAKDMAYINSVKFEENTPYIYDSWAIPNFALEYEKKKRYLKKDEIYILEPIVKEFKSFEIDKLPKALVHGDLLKMNVIKDKLGKVWIVDFSVTNLYPRILEIVIAATHLFFNKDSKKKTSENFKLLLREYEKYLPLTEKEIEVLPKFIMFSCGIEYLNTIFEERINGNKSKENKALYGEAKLGLAWGNLL